MSISTVLSPEKRRQLQELFENGNRQMTAKSYDYACEMFFTPCVLGDPGNVIYLQSFIANLQRKFGDRKKKSVLSFLGGGAIKDNAAIKMAETRKNWLGVIQAGLEALKSDPWNAPVLFSMAKASLDLGHEDTALVYLKLAIDANPNDVETNRFAGRLLRELKKYEDSLACWHRISKILPADDEARKVIGDILVEKTIQKGGYDSGAGKGKTGTGADGKTSGGGGSAVAQAAKKHKNDEDDEGAEFEDVMGRSLSFEEGVERQIAKKPEDLELYQKLADHFFQKGNYKKAEDVYLRAMKVSKNDPEIQEKIFDVQKKRFHDEAMKIKAEFEKNKTQELRDKFYETKQKLDDKTMEIALHKVQYQPGVAQNHYDLGILYQQRGRFKEAITEFQTAKLDQLKKGDCLLALAVCFQQIKQNNLAMTHYQQAVSEIGGTGEPKKRALYLAAKLAIEMEDKPKAATFLSELAAIDFSYKDVGDLLDKVG